MPDRVIDAPDLQKLYEQAHAFNMEEISPVDVMWLVETIRRLEAEKQDAYTEGWNAAITIVEDYRDFQDEDHPDEEKAATEILQLLRAGAKPSAAKQGDPS